MNSKETNNPVTTENGLFRWLVDHPKRVVFLCVVFILFTASFMPKLTQDTRSDAFLAPDNPALIYRDKVKALFGLSDPMVIAVVAEDSIFTVAGLNLVKQISDMVININNIDPEGVTSLSTENNIVGTAEGMDVDPFFPNELTEDFQAIQVRDAIRDFPLYQGSLVSQDESAVLIVVEILDEDQAEQTYADLMSALNALQLPPGTTLHVAGEGAISGYLGSYISADAQRLNPLAGVIITVIFFSAFLRFGPTIIANVIIGATVLGTLGLMAMLDVSFYVITNALPVILIGIAVADSIHIYSEYFERRAHRPTEPINDSIVFAMEAMWRPVTLTTLTTAAGFMGLYFAAYMPPFKFFGLFTALGVSLAWLFSMVLLPSVMSLLKTEVKPGLAKKFVSEEYDFFAKLMVLLGSITRKKAKTVISIAAVIVLVGIGAGSKLQVDEDRITTFHPSESLYVADKIINGRFNGSNYLDIVIETAEMEGIFDPMVLQKIEALQVYVETLPGVQNSVSVVDYLKQMNRALNGGNSDEYTLPLDRDLVAQYFLLYSTSSDPTDFEEEIDYDYQLANVRVTVNTGAFSNNKKIVEAMERYLSTTFNDEFVEAKLSGRVNLSYHWIKDLGQSHFTGVGIALFLVWLVSSLLFRSAIAGIYALIPVVVSILFVYSAMVLLSITLGIGTSMFAAVAIGLGVDFAIHTIDRIRSLYRQSGDMDFTLTQFYPTTGRALFFNLLAIALGFGVLISSKVVSLNNFGSIVAISVTTSFLVSMTLLPALVQLFKPRFITGKPIEETDSVMVPVKPLVISLLAIVGSTLFLNEQAKAETLPEGRWIMEQVNSVDDGLSVTRKLTMKMTDRRGKERVRETIGYRKYFGEEKHTILFYQTPRNVKNTGFLTMDYADVNKEDDQWLYLPAMRKARRISASDRGDYFLGTDFSYEDIKKEGKINLLDYHFQTLKKEKFNGRDVILVESIPTSVEIAKELGYGKITSWIDLENWLTVKVQYQDIKLNPLKTLNISDIRQIDGIWTRHRMEIENHKTGHSTEFVFSEVDYKTPVKDDVFSRRSLINGVR